MNRITRRSFLKTSATGIAAVGMLGYFEDQAYAFYQTSVSGFPGLRKFIQPLRGVGPGGIPVAAPDLTVAPVTKALHYSVNMSQFTDTLHPYLGPTTLWGYNPVVPLGGRAQPQKHLGGIIVAQSGTPIQVTFTNMLPPTHILPVDGSADFPDAANRFGGRGENAAVTHLHGGLTPWMSDGGPMTWYTPNGKYGPSASPDGTVKNSVFRLLNPSLKAGQAEHYYTNQQSARLMWYHDHAHDLTRLNAYAGLATAYILRDSYEGNLRNFGLPNYVENGGYEIPLVFQDKIFVGPNIMAADPTWTGPTSPGSLWYPHTYERDRWTVNGTANVLPDPSCIPEMFGDTMLANGTVYPEATVEARRYRLRILNACQARFLNLQLYVDDGSADGITLNANYQPSNAAGPDFLVIGTEGGLLPTPALAHANVPFNAATLSGSLITAPAERWDVIVDFSGFAGKKVILYNDAPAPFPGGDPRNDYFPGAPKNPTQPTPGYGPNTRQIVRFNVVSATSGDAPLSIQPGVDLTGGNAPFLVPLGVLVQNGAVQLPPGVPVRQLTLNEVFDGYGRLLQMLGTNSPTAQAFGLPYMSAATETPSVGATEVWQIANLTADTHPIHFHLVNVQVLARQPFKVSPYNGTPSYTGPAYGPGPLEIGWKETVKMNPGEVTTVIMQFSLPNVPFTIPSSPRTGGHEYVWHCHILEHEEHDMMRPLVVI